LLENGCWVANDAFCDVWGPPASNYHGAFRFGWWGVSSSVSPTRIGEFQSLRSSQFFDVDTLVSDGTQSLDLVLSGLDNEANNVRAKYYSPHLSADVRFQRFLRRWDHDPMAAPDVGPPVPPENPNDVVSDDLNVGEDYAIRVQQLNAKFKGHLADNLSWKVNVWSMRKSGERQANSTGHCFDLNPAAGSQDNRCHVLSQRQRIEWVTMEVQPVLEARFDGVTVEYSHTVRSFGQDDEVTSRVYSRFGYQGVGGNGTYGAPFIHNFVPENTTNIDRVKISADLTECNQLYANTYLGQTHNEFRDTHRDFGGADVRLTNHSIDDVTLTAYGSVYDESNELPPTFFNAAPLGLGETAATVDHPVDYTRSRVGLKSVWKPFDCGCYDSRSWDKWSTLRLVSGYEYYEISRDFATYTSARLGTFTQPDTKMHQIELGPSLKWSPELDTYVRYKGRFAEDPLIGVRESQGRFNTNQPEQLHRIELGGTWMPASNFMANAQFSVQESWNHSFYPSNAVGNQPIRFDEQSYPFVVTLWYAPTHRLSLTGAYAYSSNFIDQDITVGFRGPETSGSPFETVPWDYQGENDLISLNATYAWTPCVNLLSGIEYNWGSNYFDVPPLTDPAIPPVPPTNWSQLPSFSAVEVQTVRLTAGADWQAYRDTTLYARYIYFDWDDLSQGTYTGNSHMVLAGASLLR
jgi:hypothetical protein